MLGRRCAISAFSLAICVSMPPLAEAAVIFQVNSVADGADLVLNGECLAANGLCTLRAAIMESANEDSVVEVPSGLYLLSFQIIVAADPDVLNSLEIRGAGSGSTIIDAGGNGRHFDLYANVGKPVTLSGLTLRNGIEANAGGSILSRAALTIEDCVIEENATGDNGGGIAVVGSQLDLVRSTIRENSSQGFGGGIIFQNSGTSSVTASTISDNSAVYGGGIVNDNTTTTLNLVNSTISTNRSGDYGGGIWNQGTIWAYNVTIAYNQADSDVDLVGDGGGVKNYGTFSLRNSVVGGNTQQAGAVLDDCVGTLGTFGYNKFYVKSGCAMTHAGACGGTDTLLGSLAYLGPLQSNGGPTATHAITSGSDLKDGVVGTCICNGAETSDQRGGQRPVDTFCDIGAFEYGGLQLGLIFQDGFESGDRLAW